MITKLPFELWATVIDIDDSQDRTSLLPLQLVSKELHALVTPLIYKSISVTYLGSDDFAQWATAHGAEQVRGIENIVWEPQAPYTTFPHISIPFHRIPKLYQTFSLNPSLATHTYGLILNPYHERAGLIRPWKHAVEIGWAELRKVLPFFTNVHRISVCCSVPFPSNILLDLPTPGQLTHLRIYISKRAEELIPLLKQHPNLQLIQIPYPGYVAISERFYDALVNLPRLTSLKLGPSLWVFFSRQLSTASFSAIKHFSMDDIPTPLPSISMLNNLLSFQTTSEDISSLRQLLQHLNSVKYISLTASTSDDVTDITILFNIPSQSLEYIFLESYFPPSAFEAPPPSSLFERFPALVIVDVDDVSNADFGVWRFLRNQKNPVKVERGSLEPLWSWWEGASEEVDNITRE